jgi:DNA-binding NarL/FixJ family response regulator
MGLSILIVDDTKFLRLMLGDILRKAGHQVIAEAENGEIGVQQYRKFKPDLVVLDLTMPVMDGITTLREIRKIQPDAMIIICSAMSQRDLISEAIDAGANGYIMKPFEPDRVKQAISQITDRIVRHEPPSIAETIELEAAVEISDDVPQVEPVENQEHTEIREHVDINEHIEKIEHVQINEHIGNEDLVQINEHIGIEDLVQIEDHLAIMDHYEIEDHLELVDFALDETSNLQLNLNPFPEENSDHHLLEHSLIVEEVITLKDELEFKENLEIEFEDAIVVEKVDEFVEEVVVNNKPMDDALNFESQPEYGVVQLRKNMNRFNSSIMCNWEENVDNTNTNYFVIHTEVNHTLRIEMMNENQQKQSVIFSVEGFSYLVDWLADKGVISRNSIA